MNDKEVIAYIDRVLGKDFLPTPVSIPCPKCNGFGKPCDSCNGLGFILVSRERARARAEV